MTHIHHRNCPTILHPSESPQVLVFGEVGIKEGTEAVPGKEQLIIQRPATRHMFDRKTARTKPFVITMMGETEVGQCSGGLGFFVARSYVCRKEDPDTIQCPPFPKPPPKKTAPGQGGEPRAHRALHRRGHGPPRPHYGRCVRL